MAHGARSGEITLSGTALHSGVPAAVTLRRANGPVRFVGPSGDAPVRELQVTRTDRGVAVAHPASGFRADLVEHLLAALGGLGVYAGLAIEVHGPELPLLDGGSREWAAAINSLALPATTPSLAVRGPGRFEVGSSEYVFSPGPTRIEVEVEFEGVGIQLATWDGTPRDFIARIAPARTFGYANEAEGLRSTGRARHVDPKAVVVLDAEGRVLPPGEPLRDAELARHKLLDVVGDLYLYGGPPAGSVRARRPGHTATHEVVRRALAAGVLGRVQSGNLPDR